MQIQKKYWDVGFLRYWKLRKIPFFIMAFPTLVCVLYGNMVLVLSLRHFKR